jgi:hypothetical protein
LKVAFCLPVAPQGLTADGLNVLKNAKSNGVRIDVVNVMTMDYGDGIAPAPEGKMGSYAIDAANNTHTQLLNLGIDTHIGITPMIGQNDVPAERFYLSDAQQLTGWAADINRQSWVSLLAMWSVNRDNGGCPGKAAQGVCSGISQDGFAFTKTFLNFSRGGDGNILPAVKITSPSDRTHFEAGADIVITTEAGDTDGTIAQVEFFQGAASLGVVRQAPYSITIRNAGTGTHVYTAAATDNNSATTTSSPVRITIGNNNGGSCSSYSAWNPNQNWTTYRVGDKKTNAGKLWECRNIAYSYWEPSGPYGHFGWTNVGECN